MEALKGIQCDIHFHPWAGATFWRNVIACDMAVIPIEKGNALWWGKPENKLVLLWQLGMPVLTTATPVYRRVMDDAGLDMSCSSAAAWGEQLEKLIRSSSAELREIGEHGRHFANRAYSKEEFIQRFDTAFASLGFET
jgi:glycosyltransferase involved in cell wall biosynthesis